MRWHKVRNKGYEKMKREELHKLLFETLCIIDDICKKENVRWFLDSGTEIGSLREQNIIPWDDDMDMGMLREDYERFIEIAPKELKPEYFLQTWKTDKSYPYAFAKIRKKGTVFIEAVSQKTNAHNEIFVDVFHMIFIQMMKQ